MRRQSFAKRRPLIRLTKLLRKRRQRMDDEIEDEANYIAAEMGKWGEVLSCRSFKNTNQTPTRDSRPLLM